MNLSTKDRAIKTSAWFLYTLIVLEILFMVSPFAAYYYSIYATPLNALQESPHTAWLTMYLLPHFTYSDSLLANGLILVSWPLILTGIMLFALGFCQIYWSKIKRKGAVEVGLYRYIRHPQYVALAVIGLGASLYWSRFIVVMTFVSMLCLYYHLARLEERICLHKFGQSYRDYLDRTGMFFPQSWEAWWRPLDWRIAETGWARGLVFASVYIAVLALTVGASHLLRGHVIDSLQTDVGETRVTVFLAPVSPRTRATVVRLLETASVPGEIAYVAPSSWRVPELGLEPSADSQPSGSVSELLHPTTHGNSLTYNESRLNVTLSAATYARGEMRGIARFSQALNARPIGFLELDTAAGEIIKRSDASEGRWTGIPVPTF